MKEMLIIEIKLTNIEENILKIEQDFKNILIVIEDNLNDELKNEDNVQISNYLEADARPPSKG